MELIFDGIRTALQLIFSLDAEVFAISLLSLTLEVNYLLTVIPQREQSQ